MTFISGHRAYELWFKQTSPELSASGKGLSKPAADDDGPDLNVVVHRLRRIVEIWKLLNHQVDVLETMTPLDFLEFREHLHGASGFQRSEEHTSELQSRQYLVCRLLLEKKQCFRNPASSTSTRVLHR